MATFTITTPVNIDTCTSKAGSDTYNINGGYLTVDQHTRYGNNQNTSAGMGNMTLSATLGGTIEFNSTKIRLIPYDTGTGNVPAYDTAITQGGASGKLLCVYSALNATPTAVAAAMPASGYIMVRQWNDVSYAAGALTGIGANATAADGPGWLEIVGVDALLMTANRLGVFKVRGDYYYFQGATTDGNRATTYQLPTNGAIVYVPGVEVETGQSTGIYEFYPCAGSITAVLANIATDAVRGKFCWISTGGLVRFGNDGTNSTGGYIPPSNRRIRVPNIFFMCCTAAAKTVNVLPNATPGTRMEFLTTGGGVVDIDKACFNWYCNFAQAFSVTLTNVSTFESIVLTECASPIAWSNVGVGQTAAVSALALTMSLNFAGGTMDKCTWSRASQGNGGYTVSWADCAGFTITNERLHCLIKGTNASSGSMTLTRVSNTTWAGTILGGGRVAMITCTDITFTNTTYYDHPALTTGTAIPMFIFDMTTACQRCIFNGIDHGGLEYVQPYSGYLQVGAAGCTNITLMNLGTAAAPLYGGGPPVDCTWDRATTTMTVTKEAHNLKAGDLIAWHISSNVAPLAVTTTTATLRTVLAAPTADTFTITVTDAGAASGTATYFRGVAGQLVNFPNGAAASNIKLKRCYVPGLRTGVMGGDNSTKGVILESVWGTTWGVQLVPELNCEIRGFQSTPALTAQVSAYGTHFFETYTSGVPQNMVDVDWARTTTVATVTAANHGLRTTDVVIATVTSNAAAIVLGPKAITALTSDTFTFTCLNAGDASGTLTFVPQNGRIAIEMNEPTTETSAQVALANGSAFTSAGSLFMPVIGHQADFTWPQNIRGHSSFPIAEAVMGAATLAQYDVTYSMDNGVSYKNLAYARTGAGGATGEANVTMTDTTGVAADDYIFGTNIAPNAKVVSITNGTTIIVDKVNIGTVSGTLRFNHLPSETVSNALVGFPFRVRFITNATNATAITFFYFFTSSTDAARAAIYPMDVVPVVITAKDAETSTAVENARVYLVTDSGGPATPGEVIINTMTNSSGVAQNILYEFVSNQPVTGRVRKGTAAPFYRTAPLAGTVTSSGLSLTAFMVADG